jgi:hypothetical protein
VKSKQNHIIHSYSYAFATTLAPLVALLSANFMTMGCFKVSIVGALTSAQFFATIEKYFVRNATLTNILDFYKCNNPCYKHVEITTPLEGAFSYIFHIFYMLTPIISKSNYLTLSLSRQQFMQIQSLIGWML